MNIKKEIIFVICILFLCQSVYGMPSIESVSGVIVEDNSFIISGSGFGEKEHFQPVVWDNLEDGSCDKTATVGLWSSNHDLKINNNNNNNNNRHMGSKYNCVADMGPLGKGHAYFTGGADSPKWFAQYWFKLSPDWTWGTSTYGKGDENLANVKLFRMWSTGNDKANYMINIHGWGDNTIETVEYIGSQADYFGLKPSSISLGEWHLFQFEFSDSTSPNANDGSIKMWFDGDLILNNSNLITRSEQYTHYKRPFILGFYDSWNDDGEDIDYFYIDDAYIDNSWARIEIGDTPTWSTNTHREIQIPSSWSDDSITITVNQGSFELGETVYLFVVDENGDVSDGYEVIVGETVPVEEVSETQTKEDILPQEYCGDNVCNFGETCSTCPQDCPINSGEVCCSGVIRKGYCCSDNVCGESELCCNYRCTVPVCNKDSDCGDDSSTQYSCKNSGTCFASCSSHEMIVQIDKSEPVKEESESKSFIELLKSWFSKLMFWKK